MSYTPHGLTTLEFQMEMVQELRALFADTLMLAPDGTYRAPEVYLQELPLPEDADDSDDSFFPWIIVKLYSGEIPEIDSREPERVTVDLYFGVYNKAKDRSGHIELLNMIQRVKNHFGETGRVRNFSLTGSLKWVIDDEDTYPHYFGAVSMTFAAPRTIKEDPFV